MTERPVVDLTDPAFWADIHTPLNAARDQHPVAMLPNGEPIVLGHPEVTFVLRDPRFRTTDLLARSGLTSGRIHEWWSTVMFSTDPPEHTRLRRLVSRAFTPRSVDALEPVVSAIATSLLEPHLDTGHFDVLHDYAHQLPIRVMSHMLGVPPDDFHSFAEWTTMLGRAFSPVVDDSLRAQLEDAIINLDGYVASLIDHRRTHPNGDLLSQLIATEEGGDRLSRDELVAMVENLLFAGHDTTRGSLSIAVPVLVHHPHQLAALRDDPSRIDRAVEELLRYEPPVMGGAREAAVDVDVAGVAISAGQRVSVAIAAANRDPRVFAQPDRFDIGRTDDAPILSFGQGVHYCLGASLARLETRIGLARLLEACDDITLEHEPVWEPFAAIRHHDAVPITFSRHR